MSARGDGLGDFHEMHVHRRRIAEGQDEGCRLALFWADRAKDVGRSRSLIMGADGRVPHRAQRRVILFFCPIRASSAHQISIGVPGGRDERILSTSAAKPFF